MWIIHFVNLAIKKSIQLQQGGRIFIALRNKQKLAIQIWLL